MVFAASQVADRRLKRFVQHIPYTDWDGDSPPYCIRSSDVHAHNKTTFGTPNLQDAPLKGCKILKGDFASPPLQKTDDYD